MIDIYVNAQLCLSDAEGVEKTYRCMIGQKKGNASTYLKKQIVQGTGDPF